MARGPDYAEHLTDAERRTLDALVGEVEKRGAASEKPGRGSLRAPIAAGLAALVILSAATVVNQLDFTAASPMPAASLDGGQVTTAPAETLAELATATEAASDPTPPDYPDDHRYYRRQLHVIINGEPEPCQVTAATIQIHEPVAPPDEPYIMRLVAEEANPDGPAATRAYRSDPATGWPGCAETAETARPTSGFEGDGEPAEVGRELAEWLRSPWPRRDYVLLGPADPVQISDGGGSPTAGPGWWVELVLVLTTPPAKATHRAEFLREAASRGEAVAVPEVTVDQIGRPGTTLRVPYGTGAAAELTFDRDTGALLQRVVYTDSGVQITAYLNDRGS